MEERRGIMDTDNYQQTLKQLSKKLKSILAILLILALVGIGFRVAKNISLNADTRKSSILGVATVTAQESPAIDEIILPANVEAWHAATIYARTNGYIVNWTSDIGTQVKKGDLLAEISAPEVNAELHQAEAQLHTAEANHYLAETTAKRWNNLLKTNSVSKQEADEKTSNEKATYAIVESTRANRNRLRDLVSFQRIIAPFDGVIMSRNTDIGRLINAGSGAVPLFRLVQTDPLRVYVKIPEYYANNIVTGMSAQLAFPQFPGQEFTAELIGNASAIDINTRTLLIQLKVSNPDGKLLAGSYTEVHLKLPGKNSVILPVNALIFGANGTQVATIDGDHKAEFKNVEIGKDFGDSVEVVTGLRANEQVILNPPDSLLSGQEVHIISNKKSKT